MQGDRGVSESTFKGTKADGLRVEARMVDVFTFKDGKIAVKNAFRKDRPPVAAA
ncbi:nuclear transport factor 2 family protein [Klebsiella pneumoniae]|uniref:nuclear transport factor 2 family protein n=1 Tax=Klebsiella pneumoniae TaxID=573 RepID=UPI0026A4719B